MQIGRRSGHGKMDWASPLYAERWRISRYFFSGVSTISYVFFPFLIVVVIPEVSVSQYFAGTETNFGALGEATPLARAICWPIILLRTASVFTAIFTGPRGAFSTLYRPFSICP